MLKKVNIVYCEFANLTEANRGRKWAYALDTKNVSDNYRPALTIHYCTSSTYLPWQGETNYRGVVQVKGTDPYASEGYTQPVPWAKIE